MVFNQGSSFKGITYTCLTYDSPLVLHLSIYWYHCGRWSQLLLTPAPTYRQFHEALGTWLRGWLLFSANHSAWYRSLKEFDWIKKVTGHEAMCQGLRETACKSNSFLVQVGFQHWPLIPKAFAHQMIVLTTYGIMASILSSILLVVTFHTTN